MFGPGEHANYQHKGEMIMLDRAVCGAQSIVGVIAAITQLIWSFLAAWRKVNCRGSSSGFSPQMLPELLSISQSWSYTFWGPALTLLSELPNDDSSHPPVTFAFQMYKGYWS